MRVTVWLLIALCVFCVVSAICAGPTLYLTFKMSDQEVGVNCVNGGQPQVVNYGNLVGVRCLK